MIIDFRDDFYLSLVRNLPGTGNDLTYSMKEWFKSEGIEVRIFYKQSQRNIEIADEDYIFLVMKYL